MHMPSLELTHVSRVSRRAVLGVINLPRLAWVPFLQAAGMTNSNARLVFACLYHDAVTDSRTVTVEGTNKIVWTWVRIVTVCYNEPPHLRKANANRLLALESELNRIFARVREQKCKQKLASNMYVLLLSNTKKHGVIFFRVMEVTPSRVCHTGKYVNYQCPWDSNAGRAGTQGMLEKFNTFALKGLSGKSSLLPNHPIM